MTKEGGDVKITADEVFSALICKFIDMNPKTIGENFKQFMDKWIAGNIFTNAQW